MEPDGLPPEFSLIARHFRPLAGPGSRDLRDDVATLQPPPGRELVVTADAMVAGVHFFADDPADSIGQKLLRVNLSDIAAKGAIPVGYLLTVSAPKTTDDAWFAGFAAGLARDQREFAVTLLGGDTTSTPGPISLSLTLIGHVAPGTAPSRAGAGVGDEIWVTGTIGDGALGLAVAQKRLEDPTGFLLSRYRLPQPRLGLHIGDYAAASMDVSDGLVQDLLHICRASELAATVDAAAVPLSKVAHLAGPEWLATCLTGGDDYEILMAVPADQQATMLADAARAGIQVTRIGVFSVGAPAVNVTGGDGQPLDLASGGWSHF